MDFIKQNHHRLSQIIKNCKNTEFQLLQLKKTINFQSLFKGSKRYSSLKALKSISLLKSSRVHVQKFQKRQAKMNSFQSKGKYKQRNQILGMQILNDPIEYKQSKFTKIANIKRKQQKYQNQKQQESIQNSRVNQKIFQSQYDKQKPIKNYLPYIESAYIQTFSPKNASLSSYSMAQKQLQKSIHRKTYDERCKKYNKENMMKQYESKKKKDDEKLDVYRLNILKKISHENVRNYLYHNSQVKQKNAIFEKQQKAMYKSYTGKI